MIRYGKRDHNCEMELALDRVGGKWKGLVLRHLALDTLRFNEIKRLFPGLTQKGADPPVAGVGGGRTDSPRRLFRRFRPASNTP